MGASDYPNVHENDVILILYYMIWKVDIGELESHFIYVKEPHFYNEKETCFI